MHRFVMMMVLWLFVGCVPEQDGFGWVPPSDDDDAATDDDDAANGWDGDDVLNVLFAIDDLRYTEQEGFALPHLNGGDPTCPVITVTGNETRYEAPTDGCTPLSGVETYAGVMIQVGGTLGADVSYAATDWRVEFGSGDAPVIQFTGAWHKGQSFPTDSIFTNQDSAEGTVLNTDLSHDNPIFAEPVVMRQYDWWRTEDTGVEEVHHYDVDLTLPVYGDVLGWYRYTADYSCLYDNNPEEPVPMVVEFELQTSLGLLVSRPLVSDGSCDMRAAWQLGEQEGVVNFDGGEDH